MTETFVLESHHDRLLLHGLVVRPEQEPCRGILQVAHGMCEHKERYLPFLQEMADHGYLCIIHDTVKASASRKIWGTFIRTAARRSFPTSIR